MLNLNEIVKYMAKYWRPPKPVEPWPANVKFEPWGMINQTTVDWTKKAIIDAGYLHVLEWGGITEIRVGPDEKTDTLTGVKAKATVVGGIIYLDDFDWMPGWGLPGTIIHEAVHSWQMRNGLTGNRSGMEIGAYSVQQDFEWRHCKLNGKTPRNLFKDKIGAIGLL
jgi:hypothetical protein